MLASVLLLLATLASAEACQCEANMYDNLDEYCKFDVAIFGKATSERQELGPERHGRRYQTRVYTFKVETQYKPYGENDGGTVEIRTPLTGLSCDTAMTLNERVFLMAHKNAEGQIWFYLCDPKFYWDLWGDPMNRKLLYTNVVPTHCHWGLPLEELTAVYRERHT